MAHRTDYKERLRFIAAHLNMPDGRDVRWLLHVAERAQQLVDRHEDMKPPCVGYNLDCGCACCVLRCALQSTDYDTYGLQTKDGIR